MADMEDIVLGDIVSIAIDCNKVLPFMEVKKITRTYLLCELPKEYRVDVTKSEYRIYIDTDNRKKLVKCGRARVIPVKRWRSRFLLVWIRLARSVHHVPDHPLKDYTRFTDPKALFNIKMTFHDLTACELDNLSNERFNHNAVVNNKHLLSIIHMDE
jgi:hypothetical protein